MNEKLNKALKRANLKIADVKEKYKEKISKKCYYCNNELEISMSHMLTTNFDQVNVTTMNNDNSFMNNNSHSFVNDPEDNTHFNNNGDDD